MNVKDLRRYYKHDADTKPDSPLMAICPAHGDNNASLAVYADHAFCFGCRQWWSARDFSSKYKEISVQYQSTGRARASCGMYLPESLASTYAQWLNNEYRNKKKWLKERGFKDGTIRSLGFGYRPGAFVIPIRGVSGKLLQLRFRRDDDLGEEDGPKYFGISGWNETAVYLPHNLFVQGAQVYLCEGELDAARLTQEGLPAVSLTNGAGAMRWEMVRYFDGMSRVYICYDQDKAGKEGAIRAVAMLGQNVAKRVEWPPESGKDVTEFLKEHTIHEFMEYVND